ncbi:MAG: hypothetical protein ACI8ZO_000358 [Flavobacteriales bacterium]|jgi:uncharacterized protein (TIGR00255 family)
MTGFGKAQTQLASKKVTVEIRSLNSKGLDLSVKMPGVYREKELELRKYLATRIVRGKAELSIYIENTGVEQNFIVNQPLVESYIDSLKAMSPEADKTELLSMAMRMPEVLRTERDEMDPKEWEQIIAVIDEAIEKFQEFRLEEGNILEQEFLKGVSSIEEQMQEVLKYEGERIETVKERIQGNLEKLKVDKDQNRFEQELIFYIEKLDITEEKVRLKGHCDYFRKTVENPESSGRKLGFIGQEMGREINTMGSKANHAEIQKCVVLMKDELEKIKEQILNVL